MHPNTDNMYTYMKTEKDKKKIIFCKTKTAKEVGRNAMLTFDKVAQFNSYRKTGVINLLLAKDYLE